MSRNKILVRADLPSPFLLLPLSLPDQSPPSFPSGSPFHPIDLEILCWKLSRTWRLACFPYSSEIFVIYQRSQSNSADQVVKKLVETLPTVNVGMEEEVKSSSLIAKAAEWWLRSIMLGNNWRCVGDCSYVESTFACCEERKHLCAINARVQVGTDDGVVFIVSPDILWFKRRKISDLASCKKLQSLDRGEAVVFEDYDSLTACTILPSLYEGHVIGLSKLLPAGENFGKSEELWLFKHGLALPSSYFVNVQFSCEGHMMKQWFPSSFVLQGPGLAPAPQTIRASKAVHALESFINLVEAWDFFNEGPLKVKEVSSIGTSAMLPVWKRDTSNIADCGSESKYFLDTHEAICERSFILKNPQLILDFRTPKPASGCVFGNRILEHIDLLETATLSTKTILDGSASCWHNAGATNSTDIFTLAPVTSSGNSETAIFSSKNILDRRANSGHNADTTNPTDKFTLPPVAQNIHSETECAIERGVTNTMHASSVACTSEESISKQSHVDNLQSITQASRNKEEIKAFSDYECLADSLKGLKRTLISGKKISSISNLFLVHGKDAVSGVSKKKMTNPESDTSVIIAKVMDFHMRSKLQCLSVAELKSFLAAKKAKIGGKKEELIHRITSLLA